jgi:aminoglycoside phosphotransferase (APT) family kinase protein
MQSLFTNKILRTKSLHPDYDDHASSVTLVETEEGEYVVRSSSIIQLDNEFWWGSHRLFGLDPRSAFHLEHINDVLFSTSVIPVPRVIHKGLINGRETVVVEKLAGQAIKDFTVLSCDALYSFGKGLAHIHQKEFHYVGNVQGTFRKPLSSFLAHVVQVMCELVHRFYEHDREIVSYLQKMKVVVEQLQPSMSSSLILVDMDPTQFLVEGDRISGLVDTEAYAIAPRELDFVALEYLFDERSANAFQKGYSSVLELPKLSEVRSVYRYLYRLLRVQGAVSIDIWMNHPTYFK